MVNWLDVLAMMDATPGAPNAGDYTGWMLGPQRAARGSVSPLPVHHRDPPGAPAAEQADTGRGLAEAHGRR